MPEESAENNPNPKTENTTQPEKAKKEKPLRLSSVVRRDVYAACATILWVIGAALLNSHPKPLLIAWGLIFVGLCFFAAGLRLWLINHKTKHKLPDWFPNTCCFTFLGISFIGCAFAVWHEQPVERRSLKPYPYFTFSLRMIDPPSEAVMLTNSALSFTNLLHKTHQALGGLFIPVGSGQSNVTFRIRIDSSVLSEYAVVSITVPNAYECVPDAAWMHSESDLFVSVGVDNKSGVARTNTVQSWVYPVPFALLPGNGVALPEIRLHPPSFGLEGPPVAIMVRAKDSDAESICFVMRTLPSTFLWSNGLHKPVVAVGIKTNGGTAFNLSPEMFKTSQ